MFWLSSNSNVIGVKTSVELDKSILSKFCHVMFCYVLTCVWLVYECYDKSNEFSCQYVFFIKCYGCMEKCY